MKKLLIAILLLPFISFAQTDSLDAQYFWERGIRNANGRINLNVGNLVCTSDCMQLSDSIFSGLPYDSSQSQDNKKTMLAITRSTDPCTCGNSNRCGGQYLHDTLIDYQYCMFDVFPRSYDNKQFNWNFLCWQKKTSTDIYPENSMWLSPHLGIDDSVHWEYHVAVDTVHPNGSNTVSRVFDLGVVRQNRWHGWFMESITRPDYLGVTNVYHNGRQVLHITGANCNKFYNDLKKGFSLQRLENYSFGACPVDPTNTPVENKLFYRNWKVGNGSAMLAEYLARWNTDIVPDPTPDPTPSPSGIQIIKGVKLINLP